MAELIVHSESGRKRLWIYPDAERSSLAEELRKATTLPYEICYCMVRRGIRDVDAARAFLKPDPRERGAQDTPLPNLHDPLLMKGVAPLVDHLMGVYERGETILVHGDYDVDGMTSSTLLTRVLRSLGFSVEAAVPDRHQDGYGISMRVAEQAIAEGIRTILTCDVGISEAAKVRELMARGVSVLVTDHHHPPEELPEATAVVNPHQPGCAYPFKELCGVGVAFKVLQALCRRMGRSEVEVLYPYLDLVALGTVADVVKLDGENRVLVSVGLRQMRETRSAGLQALLDVSDVARPRISEHTCGFVLGPRLNAIGRLEQAAIGLSLLLADDAEEAAALAALCDRTNLARQEVTRAIEAEAIAQVEAMGDLSDVWALALFGETWHHGVVGIVASRIVERYGRPAFLFAPDDEGRWKGSGRARGGERVDLYEILSECGEHLAGFGGHAAAAGGSLAVPGPEGAAAFRRAFNEAARSRMTERDRTPQVEADMQVELGAIDTDLLRYLKMFAPYDQQANPSVRFLARGVSVTAVRPLRNGHVKLALEQNGIRQNEVMGWRFADRCPEFFQREAPFQADIVFTVGENIWNGVAKLQLEITDAALAEQVEEGEIEALAIAAH